MQGRAKGIQPHWNAARKDIMLSGEKLANVPLENPTMGHSKDAARPQRPIAAR